MKKNSFTLIRNLLRKKIPPSRQIPLGKVKFGDLRRVTPLFPDSMNNGDMEVDIHYINRFLYRETPNINGRILASGFSDLFETKSGSVTMLPFNHEKDFLNTLNNLQAASFDGIILNQKLHFVYELHQVFRLVYRALKPGGILLATVPGACHSRMKNEEFPCYRAFTTISLRKLVEKNFPAKNIAVTAYGNVLAATALLHGIAASELSAELLEDHDAQYPLIVAVKAIKEKE